MASVPLRENETSSREFSRKSEKTTRRDHRGGDIRHRFLRRRREAGGTSPALGLWMPTPYRAISLLRPGDAFPSTRPVPLSNRSPD